MSDGSSDRDQGAPLTIEWPASGLALVEQAAALSRSSVEEFVRRVAEAEAKRILTSRGALLDLGSAAERIGTTRGEVVRLIGEGKLKARKVEGEWLVDEDGVKDAARREAALESDQIELDLGELVQQAGLAGLALDGDEKSSQGATWCYVSQDGVLVCPRGAWRRLGRKGVLAEAREVVRRYLKRRDREAGKI